MMSNYCQILGQSWPGLASSTCGVLVAVLHIAVFHHTPPGWGSERLPGPHWISVVRMDRRTFSHHWRQSRSLGHSDGSDLLGDGLLLSEDINERIEIILDPGVWSLLLLVHFNANGFWSVGIEKLILFES